MSQEVAGYDSDSGLPSSVVEGLQTIKAGIVSTALMLFIFLAAESESGFKLGVPAAIAKFVRMPGDVYLGFSVFVFIGVVVWPLVFAAIEDKFEALPGSGDIAVRGVMFSLLLWLAFLGFGSTGMQLESSALLVLYLAFSFLAHVGYGYSLGVFYARFTR